jgi:predicted permease
MPPLDPLARLVIRLLRATLPAATADEMVGDLLEHYGRRERGRRRWLAGEALNLVWGLRRPGVRAAPGAPLTVLLEIWMRDVRFATRSLFRSRGFAAIALTSLALGIGLTTAVFSVIDGVLLRPLPYGESDAIVRIRQVIPARLPDSDEIQRTLLRFWAAGSRTIDAFAPYAVSDARVGAMNESFVGLRIEVGDRFFDVLRTAPMHGRLFGRADGDNGAPMVAILSHAFWRSAFAGDPSAIGRVVLIDDRPAEVVGVLPEDFTYPSGDAAVYVPGRWNLPEAVPGIGRAFFGPPLALLGRMRAGITVADVEREGAMMSTQFVQQRSNAAPPSAFEVVGLQDDLVKHVRPALIVLLASAGCVLAIVCVNLTNLLLARGTVRQKEMAVRAALGASRWGMARPLVLEGLILALLGGGAALLLATVLVASLPLTATVDPMIAARVHIDGRVLAFTLAVSGLIGVVVGVLPVWQGSGQVKTAVSGSHLHVLPATAVRAETARSALVVVQVALALVLAVGATLLSRSLVALLTVDLGFQPAQALSAQIRLPPSGGSTYDWRARFYQDFLDRLTASPGVRAAGFSTSLPMSDTFTQSGFHIDGVPPPDPSTPSRAHREAVTPGYFAAIGLPIVSGRGILPADTAGKERVLVVNEAFVKVFLAGRDPIGQRIMQFGDWYRIAGVARSKRHAGLRSELRPEFYVPLAQSPPDIVTQSGAGIVVRGTSAPLDLLPFVRSTMRSLQPQAALEHEGALDDRIWSSTAEPRFYAMVMGVFAALALVTALVGLFGVLSYVVERRRVEIGVRRALGATSRDISGLVLGKGLKLVGLAIPIGLAGAAAGAGLMRSLLFGIAPSDPMTFGTVALVVAAVALAACAWPARRATGIEPLDALRED